MNTKPKPMPPSVYVAKRQKALREEVGHLCDCDLSDSQLDVEEVRDHAESVLEVCEDLQAEREAFERIARDQGKTDTWER